MMFNADFLDCLLSFSALRNLSEIKAGKTDQPSLHLKTELEKLCIEPALDAYAEPS